MFSPVETSRFRRQATCHPERKNHGHGLCKSCSTKVWRANNPYKVKQYAMNASKYIKSWLLTHPENVQLHRKDNNEKRCLEPEWYSLMSRLRQHKLTLDQYHALQEQQDFCCAICHEEKPLVIDHNHQMNKVRGLLCSTCNAGIGSLKESAVLFNNAGKYIEHYNAN